MEDDIKRQFQIKLNVLKRCLKEYQSYQKEIVDQQKYIEKLIGNNSDEYVVAKQKQVLGESERILPECCRGVEDGKKGLKDFIDRKGNFLSEGELKEANLLLF